MPKKILVVDDSALMRRVLCDISLHRILSESMRISAWSAV